MDSNFLRLTRFVLALSLAVVAVVGSGCSSAESVPTITGAQLSTKLNQETVWIIDTREPDQFDEKHINTGGSVSAADMEERFKATSEDTVVVCGAGPVDPSAESLAKKLKERGYKKVFILEGGFSKWVDGGGLPGR